MNITIDGGQILFGLAALVSAVGLFWSTVILPSKALKASQDNAKNIAEVSAKADALHLQGNSNLDKMNKMAEAVGNVQGRKEQTEERRVEAAENKP